MRTKPIAAGEKSVKEFKAHISKLVDAQFVRQIQAIRKARGSTDTSAASIRKDYGLK